MRRESSTVVAVVGEVAGPLLAEVSHSPNVALARPPEGEADPLTAASSALRDASRKSAPFVLVPADPLALLADAWQTMWNLAQGPLAAAEFEERSAQALAAWRAKRFELPDYYLVLTRADATGGADEARPDLHLGPLRAARPRRVSAVVISDGTDPADAREQAARLLHALRTLGHGPWWPPLDELIDTIRRYYPASLAEAGPPLAGRPPA